MIAPDWTGCGFSFLLALGLLPFFIAAPDARPRRLRDADAAEFRKRPYP
jgi:hypothetical protein